MKNIFLIFLTTLLFTQVSNAYNLTKQQLRDIGEFEIRADEARTKKQYKKAIELYVKAVEVYPTEIAVIGLAESLEDNKEYVKAEKVFKVAENLGYKVNFKLAMLYKYGFKDYVKAIEYLNKMIDNDSMSSTEKHMEQSLVEDSMYGHMLSEVMPRVSMELKNKKAYYHLALIYDNNLKEYKKAIVYYEKAIKLGHEEAISSLAGMYELGLKDNVNALKYYKLGIKKGDFSSRKDIAWFYYETKKDKLKAAAYYIALIERDLDKKVVLDHLKNTWKIDDSTLIEAYKLQKTLVPYPYIGKL